MRLPIDKVDRQTHQKPRDLYLVLSLVTSVGGFGGFLASVRAMGVVHPPGINVSADDTVRGGAEGNFFAFGGGTKPGSLDPSPAARAVPEHRVAANSELNPIMSFLFMAFSFRVRSVRLPTGILCGLRDL